MKQAFIYSLKVWLTATVIRTLLQFALQYYNLQRNYRMIKDISKPVIYNYILVKDLHYLTGNVMLFFLLGLSIFGTLFLLRNKNISVLRMKVYLNLVGLAFFMTLFAIILAMAARSYRYFMTVDFAICIIAVALPIWLFQLKRPLWVQPNIVAQ
jgi:hypothetical protein